MILLAAAVSFAQPEYPRPVTEYSEETGPDSMAFLSYPKYYTNTFGHLTEVNTTLVPSGDPEWDYTVGAGIWTLRVKRDGTFQASHEGDSFTYRFASLGFGRGSGYRAVDLGEPDFSRLKMTNNTVLWEDVYKDIDLVVTYVPDILKVDVVVRKAFVADLRAEVNAKRVDPDDHLTVRFDIVNALVRSRARQGGQDKDLYKEALAVDKQPIEFFQDERNVHTLRLAETYAVDETGKRIQPNLLFGEEPVRTRQAWQLRRNQPGLAEISAHVGDMTAIRDRDVVIDPSLYFQNDISPAEYKGCQDSFLYINESVMPGQRKNYNYGRSATLANWAYYNPPSLAWNETRPILRFMNIGNVTNNVPPNKMITSAMLTLTLADKVGGTPAGVFRVEPFGIRNEGYNWVTGTGDHEEAKSTEVTWSHAQYPLTGTLPPGTPTPVPRPWRTEEGGAGQKDRIDSAGIAVDIRNKVIGDSVSWVLNPSVVQNWYEESLWGGVSNGLVLECIDKMTNYNNATSYYWHSCESTSWNLRPKLYVTYENDPNLGSTAELLSFAGLDHPMPDGPSAAVFWQGNWFAYYQSTFLPSEGTYGKISRNFAAKISDPAGLAVPTLAAIQDRLLRVHGGSTTPVPTATGTPYAVVSAPYNQFVRITPGPNDWNNRMMAIFAHYPEYNNYPTPAPVRLHTFIHVEDTHDGYGSSYGFAYNPSGTKTAHAGITRIGYMRSNDGINFTLKRGNAIAAYTPLPTYTLTPTPLINSNPGPLVECFMTEEQWVYPYGTPNPAPPTPTPGNTPIEPPMHPYLETSQGVRHPNVIEKDGYVYLFYDRNLSPRYVESRLQLTPIPTFTLTPTPHPDREALKKALPIRTNGGGVYYMSYPCICVARASKSDFLAYNPDGPAANPFKNYYNDGSVSNNGFTQPANGGWSSPVVFGDASDTSIYREAPSVSYNTFLNTHIMICKGNGYDGSLTTFAFYLHLPYNDSLTRWSYGLRVDVDDSYSSLKNDLMQYPYLINNDSTGGNRGSFTISGQNNYLYFNKLRSITDQTYGANRVRFVFQP